MMIKKDSVEICTIWKKKSIFTNNQPNFLLFLLFFFFNVKTENRYISLCTTLWNGESVIFPFPAYPCIRVLYTKFDCTDVQESEN